jgi:hypothetical protein
MQAVTLTKRPSREEMGKVVQRMTESGDGTQITESSNLASERAAEHD